MAYVHRTLRRGGLAVVVAAVCMALAPGDATAQKGKKKRAPAARKAKAKKKVRPPAVAPIKVDVAAEGKRLFDAKPDAAAKAAEMLGKTKDARALAHLLDALATGLHPKVAATALRSVGAHGGVAAFDTLAYYAHYRDPRVRAAAVGALQSQDDSRAVELVLASLRDGHKSVRGAAANVVAARKIKRGIEPLLELMKRGDDATVQPLADMADADLARAVGELMGEAPDALLARCLGAILLRPSFKPEAARVQVVRSLGKVPGTDAVEQLTTYIEKTPEKPPRQSRREAESLVEARLTGGI